MPVRSDGRRSGVNWIRLKPLPTVLANAFKSMVFPVPGTSSKSTCPEHKKLIKISRTVSSLPTITREQLSTTRSVCSLKWLYSIACLLRFWNISLLIIDGSGHGRKKVFTRIRLHNGGSAKMFLILKQFVMPCHTFTPT